MDVDNNIFVNLDAIKLEIEEVKHELPYDFKVDRLNEFYFVASDAAMQCFNTILRYFQIHSRPHCMTYQIPTAFEGYDAWNTACVGVLGQLGVQTVFNHPLNVLRNDVSVADINRSISPVFIAIKSLTYEIRERDPDSARTVANSQRLFMVALNLVKDRVVPLPAADYITTNARSQRHHNPLETFVAIYYPDYDAILFR